MYGEVEECLKEKNIHPNVVFRAKGDDAAKALVASGIGISLVPNIEMKYPNVKYIPIADVQFDRKIFLIWKKGSVSKTMEKLLNT